MTIASCEMGVDLNLALKDHLELQKDQLLQDERDCDSERRKQENLDLTEAKRLSTLVVMARTSKKNNLSNISHDNT